MACIVVIETRVWKLEVHLLCAFINKVVDLLSFEKVTNRTL